LPFFGTSVANISRRQHPALIGGLNDNGGLGAVLGVHPQRRRLESVRQQADAGRRPTGNSKFGTAVALSDDGKTAVIGGPPR